MFCWLILPIMGPLPISDSFLLVNFSIVFLGSITFSGDSCPKTATKTTSDSFIFRVRRGRNPRSHPYGFCPGFKAHDAHKNPMKIAHFGRFKSGECGDFLEPSHIFLSSGWMDPMDPPRWLKDWSMDFLWKYMKIITGDVPKLISHSPNRFPWISHISHWMTFNKSLPSAEPVRFARILRYEYWVSAEFQSR